MANQIYVDPSITAAVIQVVGVCYYRVGPASVAPQVFSVDATFSTCDQCQSSSSSSSGSGSSSSSINCADLDCNVLSNTYTVNFSLTLVATTGATCSCSGNALVTYEEECTWGGPPEPIIGSCSDGTYFQVDNIYLTYNPAGPNSCQFYIEIIFTGTHVLPDEAGSCSAYQVPDSPSSPMGSYPDGISCSEGVTLDSLSVSS